MREEEESRRPVTGALFEHQRIHLEAELNWTRGVLERVERGALGVALRKPPGQEADGGQSSDNSC